MATPGYIWISDVDGLFRYVDDFNDIRIIDGGLDCDADCSSHDSAEDIDVDSTVESANNVGAQNINYTGARNLVDDTDYSGQNGTYYSGEDLVVENPHFAGVMGINNTTF